MIIVCNNCNKNFSIESGLIPDNGRLLQCISCSHKWFFKKVIEENSAPKFMIKANNGEPTHFNVDAKRVETETLKTIELLDRTTKDVFATEKISNQKNNKIVEITNKDKVPVTKIFTNRKSYNILALTIVFITSFIAIIIVLDTFQKPISIFFPNIEFILFSLYETLNDIILFFNDLI